MIKLALAFILLACIFDLFDGRVARMGGVESPFGREFDSLADLISFGVAPAFLVHRVVLRDVPSGTIIPGTRLVHRLDLSALRRVPAGAVQLPRRDAQPGAGKDFLGFPIPSAAGLVASLTLLIIISTRRKKASATGIICSGRAGVFVGDDGQHRAVSELQVARPALDHARF
jgi:CDP-diacylglycerol--serine O-phosphatidyltransferase